MALAWAKDLVKEIAPFFKGNSLHLQQSVEFNARGTTKKQWRLVNLLDRCRLHYSLPT